MKTRKNSPARILSPGKLFLLGEYAVLEGAPAVVMSVNRYVQLVPCDGPVTSRRGLVPLARAAAAHALGVRSGRTRYDADSSAFHRGALKLGLGSSAAVTVASVASVFHEAGRDVEDPATRCEMWRVTKTVHDSFQGASGSGADLAASLMGGVTSFHPGGTDGPVFGSWHVPAGVHLRFAWTRRAASTPAILRTLKKGRARNPRGCAHVIREMGAQAERFVSRGERSAAVFIESLREYGSLMQDLGRFSGAGIVTEEMERAARHAVGLGGGAKPSGAGGGDFLVAAFDDPGAAAAFSRGVGRLGFVATRFHPARRGVRAAPVTVTAGDLDE